jgi:peptide/nickel transport system permease protein
MSAPAANIPSATPVESPSAVLPKTRGAIRTLISESLRQRRTQVGLVLLVVIVFIAVFGPLLTRYSPTQFVGNTFASPSSKTWLGTDYLGRDVWSRFLAGGRTLLVLALLSTVLGVGSGTLVGVVAGYSLRAADEVLMRFMDLVLAFPPIVLALMCVAIVGSSGWLIVLVVAVSHMPQTARVMRAAVLQVRDLDFIKYAEAVGLRRGRMLREQVLPNVVAPLTVEFGLRLTYSIGLIASLDYLGLGVQPPLPDWGLMIQENQSGLSVSPWPVLVAVAAIAILTVGSNLVTDGIGRSAAGIDRRLEA